MWKMLVAGKTCGSKFKLQCDAVQLPQFTYVFNIHYEQCYLYSDKFKITKKMLINYKIQTTFLTYFEHLKVKTTDLMYKSSLITTISNTPFGSITSATNQQYSS